MRRRTNVFAGPSRNDFSMLRKRIIQIAPPPFSLSVAPRILNFAPVGARFFFNNQPVKEVHDAIGVLRVTASCVTMQMVAPPDAASRKRSITASTVVESQVAGGSSASRMLGVPPNARATATRCC
jgi:hypothetical protein